MWLSWKKKQKWAAYLPGFKSIGGGMWHNNMLARNLKRKDSSAIGESAQSQKEGT